MTGQARCGGILGQRGGAPVAHLELSEPSLVDELVDRLRALDCDVERVGASMLEIAPPEVELHGEPPDQEVVELTFLVRALLRDRPDVTFRVTG